MFGISFVKAQPTTHLIQYRGRKVVREGTGLSFFYYRADNHPRRRAGRQP